MTSVFVDTSFFIAFLCRRDRLHAEARQRMETLSCSMVTTEWVLIELGNFMSRSADRVLFVPFVRHLAANPHVRIVTSGHTLFINGMDIVCQPT